MNHNLLLLLLLLTACTGRQEHMRERLQYVSACNRADTVFTQRWLPTVDSLVSYFAHHGSANDRMMAHYVAGRVHHDMGEAPQALDCYQRAAEQADTTRADCDLYTLYAVYGQMADLYHAQYLPQDELEALQKAEWYSMKNNDILVATIAFGLRSRPYYLQNDTDKVLSVESQLRKRYLEFGDTARAAIAIRATISILLDRRQYDEAYKLMQIYENESELFDSTGQICQGKELYYYDKGRYLLALGQLDSALYYFNETLQAGFHEAAYKGFLAFYKQKHIADSIAKYAQLFADANDASYLNTEQDVIHMSSAMYDYGRYQRMAEEERQQTKLEKGKRRIAVALLIVALVTAFSAFRLQKKNGQKKYMQLSKDFDVAKTELAHARQEAQQQELDHMEQIREKDEKAAKLLEQIKAGNADNSGISKDVVLLERRLHNLEEETEEMRMQHLEDMNAKNREVKALMEKSEKLASKLNQYSSVDMESAFKKTAIYQLFDERRHPRYAKKLVTDQEWEALTDEFRKYFVQYYAFIFVDNNLSVNQRRYCILVRLGFSAADIDILMKTDTNKRYRLRRLVNERLFGNPDAKSLEEHLKRHF